MASIHAVDFVFLLEVVIKLLKLFPSLDFIVFTELRLGVSPGLFVCFQGFLLSVSMLKGIRTSSFILNLSTKCLFLGFVLLSISSLKTIIRDAACKL